jgi:hypothetical protein
MKPGERVTIFTPKEVALALGLLTGVTTDEADLRERFTAHRYEWAADVTGHDYVLSRDRDPRLIASAMIVSPNLNDEVIPVILDSAELSYLGGRAAAALEQMSEVTEDEQLTDTQIAGYQAFVETINGHTA